MFSRWAHPRAHYQEHLIYYTFVSMGKPLVARKPACFNFAHKHGVSCWSDKLVHSITAMMSCFAHTPTCDKDCVNTSNNIQIIKCVFALIYLAVTVSNCLICESQAIQIHTVLGRPVLKNYQSAPFRSINGKTPRRAIPNSNAYQVNSIVWDMLHVILGA